jgi:hypothetical protein
MDFLTITNEELDNIDLLSYSQIINSLEYQGYFMSKSGQEHYRLLSYISQNHNSVNILDIGTLKGCSALALSMNSSNKVFSFNVENQLDLNETPTNIEFIIDNVINGKYDDLILNSTVILLDTFHDGTFEQEFLDYLIQINYKGNLLLDDIYLNDNMKSFWENINLLKNDITHIGHSTGTGLVIFN